MAENIKKTYILLGITALILAILACGSVRVGVVTPSPEGELQPESQGSEQESELAALEAVETQTEVEIIIEPDDLTIEISKHGSGDRLAGSYRQSAAEQPV